MYILSLPFKQNTIPLPSTETQYTEYRIDYHPKPERIDFSLFTQDSIVSYHPAPGMDNYVSVITKAWNSSSALIDVDFCMLPQLTELIWDKRVILSLHLGKVDFMLIKELLSTLLPVKFIKIAVYCANWIELIEVWKLIKRSGRNDLIFSVMGKFGKLQRILYHTFSSEAVYLCKDIPTAPGQLSLYEAKLFRAGATFSKVFGIIGDESVNNSLSLTAYNRIFWEQAREAIYLPIVAKDTIELEAILTFLAQRFELYGFSITIPFKKALPHSLGQVGSIANTWLYKTQKLYNTDLDALQRALDKLEIRLDDKILIHGSGASAEAFIRYLQEHRFYHLFVVSRNQLRMDELCSTYNIKPTSDTCYDLLINCSPFGKDTSDDPKSLPPATKLIDLAYQDGTCSLVANAIAMQIPYVGGSEFWQWQFTAQNALLLNEL